jgi:hypothetical protein
MGAVAPPASQRPAKAQQVYALTPSNANDMMMNERIE